MVPMSGNKPSFNPEVFAKDENVGIAYGMGLTAEKVAAQWKVRREAQDAFALESHQKALDGAGGRRVRRRDDAGRGRRALPEPGDRREWHRRPAPSTLDEGPRADTSLEGLAKLQAGVRRQGQVTAGNSSQTSDGAGALILASEKAVKQFDLKPLARFVSFAVARRAARDHGHRPDRGDPGGAEATPASRRTRSTGSS